MERGRGKCGRQREGEANKEVEGRIYRRRVRESKEGAGREGVNSDRKIVQQTTYTCIYKQAVATVHVHNCTCTRLPHVE